MIRATLILSLLLAACADEQPPADDAPPEVPAPPYNLETLPQDSTVQLARRDSLPPRPGVIEDSISIEGMAQPERLTLVRSPAGFSPPFSTYLPSQMQVDFVESDTTPSVRIVAAFAGQPNPEAYLQVRLYPPGAAELVARTGVDVYLRGRDPLKDNVSPSEGWGWTIDAYDFQYGAGRQQSGFMGTIGIARHGNRFFHVLAHYPADYGDGVGPRFERILREWRWEDDGTMLVPPR